MLLLYKYKHYFIILFVLITVVFISTPYRLEKFENRRLKFNIKLNQLEKAYQLCLQSPNPKCSRFIHHYEGIIKQFKMLKHLYCKDNPSVCKAY